MKQNIHPNYKAITVTCVCGNTFETGSTLDKISVEVCSNCHPFFTGKEKIIDTMNLAKKFEQKQKAAATSTKVSKKTKRSARKDRRTTQVSGESNVTLKDMLSQLQ